MNTRRLSARTIKRCQTPRSKPYADSSQSLAPRLTGPRSLATRSARRCRMLRGWLWQTDEEKLMLVWRCVMQHNVLYVLLKDVFGFFFFFFPENDRLCWALSGNAFIIKTLSSVTVAHLQTHMVIFLTTNAFSDTVKIWVIPCHSDTDIPYVNTVCDPLCFKWLHPLDFYVANNLYNTADVLFSIPL